MTRHRIRNISHAHEAGRQNSLVSVEAHPLESLEFRHWDLWQINHELKESCVLIGRSFANVRQEPSEVQIVGSILSSHPHESAFGMARRMSQVRGQGLAEVLFKRFDAYHSSFNHNRASSILRDTARCQ